MEGAFKMKIELVSREEQAARDRAYWRAQSPEARLAEVERLRIESERFLYERPAALRRVLEVARKESR